jgi:hypothetical protein
MKQMGLGGGETYYSSGGINVSRKSVDGDDMCRFVVPRAVFPPVCSGNLLPGIVKGAIIGEHLHYGGCLDLSGTVEF